LPFFKNIVIRVDLIAEKYNSSQFPLCSLVN